MGALSKELTEDLRALAWAWATAPHGSLAGPPPERAAVPDALRQRITAHAPFRDQALEDARLWVGMPLLLGIGLDVVLLDPALAEPCAPWQEVVVDLGIDVSWSLDMGGCRREGFQTRLRRVGVEGGAWRIIEVWDAVGREQRIREQEMLEAFLRRRGR